MAAPLNRSTLNRATSPDAEPTPGYLFGVCCTVTARG